MGAGTTATGPDLPTANGAAFETLLRASVTTTVDERDRAALLLQVEQPEDYLLELACSNRRVRPITGTTTFSLDSEGMPQHDGAYARTADRTLVVSQGQLQS